MKRKIEILSPAGSYESMKAAIAAGADAVYIGGSRFGARAYADNLTEEQLLEAIDYVHLHGRKIYLTVNTLLKEKELRESFYEYLRPYYERGLDAVIVQDIGVLQFVKEHFPDLPIHASTQMTITNALGARFLEEQGVERVVTARELQLEEIKDIREKTDVEIESFVHGALCYCYSGQCLYSSMLGGRSGNRGQCAQPCRLPYKVNGSKESSYVLSLKDICTLEYIPELVEAGIDSFKIEGRMKKPEYVALVTAMYRKYTDQYLEHGEKAFCIDPKDRQMLMDLYNRGGSHGGYYHTKNGRKMLSLDRPNHAGVPALQVVSQSGKTVTAKAITDIHAGDVVELPTQNENYTFSDSTKKGQTITFYSHKRQNMKKGQILNRTRNESLINKIHDTIISRKVKEKINGKLILSVGEPAKLEVVYQDCTVDLTGEPVQEALNQPMQIERIEKQMRKTGNTEFEFEHLQINLLGNVFLPMQSLNELRRKALDTLEDQILQKTRRKSSDAPKYMEKSVAADTKCNCFYVSVETSEQLLEVLKESSVQRIYLDCNLAERIWENPNLNDMIQSVHERGKTIYLGMPHIFRTDANVKYEACYAHIFEAAWDGVLIRNYESYQFLKAHGYQGNIVTDYNLYQFNRYAKKFWMEEEVEATTAPLELNYNELREVGLESSELVVYGHVPMMVSAQCVTKTVAGCRKKKGILVMKDRYQKEFFVKNNCDYCYNIIYNSLPVVLTDQKQEIEDLMPKAMRLQFTVEKKENVRKVLDLYRAVFLENQAAREPDMEFTRGHFKRGIK